MKIFKVFIWLSIIGTTLVAFLVIGLFFYFNKDLPTAEEITNFRVIQSTKIYDRTGKILLYEISGEQKRTVVPFEEIPRYLKDATIAIEDERFYEEPAFDWKAIIRAFLVNLKHGRILQGGSTITQQLAKKVFLSDEKTISRKIKEFILAIKLSKYYSKDQILALYLNQIPYGSVAYGVEAASQLFFNKSVKELNLAESAILAALPKAPTYYSPWGSHQKELLERARLIIKKMYELGKITKEERDEALKYKVVFAPPYKGMKAPHFVVTVQDYLTQKYGEDFVRNNGLKVITTLDWELQQIAEKVVAEGAKRNEELYQGKNAALVAQDPKTGQILALVGSRDYFDTKNEGNFNVATQGLRQPGSALKPFVYLTAFKKGYTPQTVVFDVPTEFNVGNPNCPVIPIFDENNNTNESTNESEDKNCFHPQNFDKKFRGPISLKDALAQSVNVPAVKVLYLAGLKETIETATQFGITTLTNPAMYGLSLVLGGGAVKLIDLVNAYAVLAAEGVKRQQTMILEIRDSNNQILESFKDQPQLVVDPQYPRLINNILSDIEARAPLYSNNLSLTVFPGYDVALKTGTSNDYRDAWALGYTPFLVVGVWAGNNDNLPMQKHGSSILAAIPIWHNFMKEALKHYLPETFNRPEPIVVENPILVGNYPENQIHSILYYIDRNNPTGPPPLNPSADPQFNNWEAAVLAWAEQNISNFKKYNQISNSSLDFDLSSISSNVLNWLKGSPVIFIRKPVPGEKIIPNQPTRIIAQIRSDNNIVSIKVYLNKSLVSQKIGNFGKNYNFDLVFISPSEVLPQNLLEIEVGDENNYFKKNSVILYGN